MHSSIAQYENRIREIDADADLASARFNGEGLMNDIVICGDRIYRFAKDQRRAQILQNELLILDRLRPRLSVPIPAPDRRGLDFMSYRLIAGEPLRNEFVRDLSISGQQRLADQLGRCLRELHTTPVDGLPPTRAPVTHAAQCEIRREAEQLVYPLLMGHQRAWAERFFDAMLGDPRNFDYEPRLIHGDLWAEHLLVDAQAELCGVIDFGMAGAGDPANDIACLLQTYGESFVSRMQTAYPELQQYMQRGCYYARVIEFEWAIRGLSDNESFWFTAHLGNARDFRN